jgi:hypothetical protein
MTVSFGYSTYGVGRFLNRSYYPVLSAAAADIAFEFASDFGLGRRRISPEKADALHDHAWRAVAALHGIAIYKGLLQWVEAFTIRQAFDRGDLFPRD